MFRARPAFLPGKSDPYCPETGRTSFPRSRAPQGRAGLADAPVSLPGRIFDSVARGAGTPSDGCSARRGFVSLPLFSLSFSGSIAGICKSPKRSACPDRKPNAADRKTVALGCRIGPECRLLSGRSTCARAAASSEASYSVRIDTAIICFVMWRAYPPRSCDIS